MTQEISIVNNKVMVKLFGSMYVEDADFLRAEMLKYIDKGNVNFSFDLSKLEYIDSSGMGVLVGIHKKALKKAGNITISGLHGLVKELFELTRLTKVFIIE